MQQREKTVECAEAARLLTQAAQYLAPFALRPTTISGAAQHLGLPLGRVHYWVRKAEALGLLEVAREQKRAGRPQRHYLTTARTFFVPTYLLNIGRHIDRELAAYRHYLHSVERVQPDLLGDGPLTVSFGQQGASLNFGQQGWSGEALHIRAGNLHLLPEDARELKQELSAVFARYYARHSSAPQAERYLVHVGVVLGHDQEG